MNLTLTPDQIRILVEALRCYIDIGVGKFSTIEKVYNVDEARLPPERAERISSMAEELTSLLNLNPQETILGVHNPRVDRRFRIASDLKEAISCQLIANSLGSHIKLARFAQWDSTREMTLAKKCSDPAKRASARKYAWDARSSKIHWKKVLCGMSPANVT